MAGSNFDRSDTIRMLRDQASRVYLQTIAANEREDRILHKKLDALDLEHRAQFLKMKKWIHDAETNRKKRLTRLQSNVSYSNELPALDKSKKQKNDCPREGRTLKREGDDALGTSNLVLPIAIEQEKDNRLKELGDREEPILYKANRRRSSALQHRVKYTESEVAHLKASFAGQRTPPHLRRRTFLPHLQKSAAVPIGNGKRRRRGRKKERGKDVQQLQEKLSDLDIEGARIGDERLPKITIDGSKTPVTSTT